MGDDGNSYIKISPVESSGAPWDEKGRIEIVQIFISHDTAVKSIQFQYVENGSLVTSERHGTNIGDNFDVVTFNYPTEYITQISGYKSSYVYDEISSLTFGTNCGVYGPFGQSSGTQFSFKLGDHRQFGGFHGTAHNNVLRSIGVYLRPIKNLDDSLWCSQC